MEYHIRNGKTDSTLISTQRFNQLAAAFLPGDLDSSRFRKRFREQAFLDQTTGLLSFTYSTTDTLFGLRRVDVLAEPGPASDKVKSIYMELSSGNTDSPALRKLYWVAGKSFSILQINRPLHGEATTDQTRVLWDGSE
jgi:hypothetical protein